MPQRPPIRSRYKFSLLSMFVVTTVCAVVIALFVNLGLAAVVYVIAIARLYVDVKIQRAAGEEPIDSVKRSVDVVVESQKQSPK